MISKDTEVLGNLISKHFQVTKHSTTFKYKEMAGPPDEVRYKINYVVSCDFADCTFNFAECLNTIKTTIKQDDLSTWDDDK